MEVIEYSNRYVKARWCSGYPVGGLMARGQACLCIYALFPYIRQETLLHIVFLYSGV